MIAGHLRKLMADESGGPAVEYGLIPSLMALAGVEGFRAYGSALAQLYDSITGALREVVAASGTNF